jgi:hypothetical protein
MYTIVSSLDMTTQEICKKAYVIFFLSFFLNLCPLIREINVCLIYSCVSEFHASALQNFSPNQIVINTATMSSNASPSKQPLKVADYCLVLYKGDSWPAIVFPERLLPDVVMEAKTTAPYNAVPVMLLSKFVL